MSEHESQNSPRTVQISDREAIRLIQQEAAIHGESLAKVAARVVIRHFASRPVATPAHVHTG